MNRGAHRSQPAIEPPPSRWAFPDDPGRLAEAAGSGEVVGVGADLEPGTLLAAYRSGLFPMPARRGTVAWWSPEPRAIVPLQAGPGAAGQPSAGGELGAGGGGAAAGAGSGGGGVPLEAGPGAGGELGAGGQPGAGSGLRVSRSLRRSSARFEIRVDTAFDEVIDACADRRRPGAWIDRDIKRAYRRLHELGWVHTVEAWDERGQLAGGLYGVAIGGLFAGESMFHLQTDASKVALVGLVGLLRDAGVEGRLLDVQWATPHLVSLGAVEVSRARYHELLTCALRQPQPAVFGGA